MSPLPFVPEPMLRQIWVFNRDYTQYVPLLVSELQRIIGQPALFVFDCDNAGHLLPHFAPSDDAFSCLMGGTGTRSRRLASTVVVADGDLDDLGDEVVLVDGSDPRYKREWIVLASCGPNETLPTCPDYPADLFTACLTTPLKVALRHAVIVSACGASLSMIVSLSG